MKYKDQGYLSLVLEKIMIYPSGVQQNKGKRQNFLHTSQSFIFIANICTNMYEKRTDMELCQGDNTPSPKQTNQEHDVNLGIEL